MTLVQTVKRLKMLENVVLNKRQRQIHRMARWNYLSANASTSEHECSEYPNFDALVGYTISGSLDKRLVKNTVWKADKPADKTAALNVY